MRFVALAERLRREYPKIHDPVGSIRAGHVRVNGAVMVNPRSLVRTDGVIAVVEHQTPRAIVKLRAALTAFAISAQGCVALDVGASTGGFTSALLEDGARRVYAVDAGHGQLLGSLRQDQRVVNLERTNLGMLTTGQVPESLDLITVDLSYLALAAAVPQLEVLSIAPGAVLIGLVKPMYELGLPTPPTDGRILQEALDHAIAGIAIAPWRVGGHMLSPIKGRRGSVEWLVYAQRK